MVGPSQTFLARNSTRHEVRYAHATPTGTYTVETAAAKVEKSQACDLATR